MLHDNVIMGKCVFHNEWAEVEEFSDWLLRVENDRHSARCSVCYKAFDVSNMGEGAVRSHMKGQKHCRLIEKKRTAVSTTPSISGFFNRSFNSLGS